MGNYNTDLSTDETNRCVDHATVDHHRLVPVVTGNRLGGAQCRCNARRGLREELDILDREYVASAEYSQVELEKSFDAVVAAHEQASHAALVPTFNIVEFTLKLILMFLLTVAALKLACKYWGAEVFWSGILIVAAIDSLIRGGMALAGKFLLELPTLFYLDEAVSGIVMVLMLKRMSINQSTAQAVELTMTAKTFTIVVGAFLVSMILQSFN